MEESLKLENLHLKETIKKLEEKLDQAQSVYDKYKESCQFQMNQLRNYNDSLKEELHRLHYEEKEDDNEREVVSESVELFRESVYSPKVSLECKEYSCIAKAHSANVLGVIPWSVNPKVLFSSDVAKRIVVMNWDSDNYYSIIQEETVSGPCCTLAIMKEGSFLLAGCMDGYVYSFAIVPNTDRSGVSAIREVDRKRVHNKAVLRIKTCDSLGIAVSTSYDNTVAILKMNEKGELIEDSRFYFKYTCDGICICPNHNTLLIAERNQPYINYISLHDQKKGEISINARVLDRHVSFCITDIITMQKEKFVVVLTDKNNIIVYEYQNNKRVQEIHSGSMLSDSYYTGSIAMDSLEKYVITICPDHCIRFFSLYSGEEVLCLKGHSQTVRSMYYCNDIKPFLFTCSYDHTIRVWR